MKPKTTDRPRGRIRNVACAADRTYKGIRYDSKAEMLHAFELDALKAAGKIEGWERQVCYPLRVNSELICKFIIDFRVVANDGSWWLEEVKGWETPEYKIKRKLFKALYPAHDYRVVKV